MLYFWSLFYEAQYLLWCGQIRDFSCRNCSTTPGFGFGCMRISYRSGWSFPFLRPLWVCGLSVFGIAVSERPVPWQWERKGKAWASDLWKLFFWTGLECGSPMCWWWAGGTGKNLPRLCVLVSHTEFLFMQTVIPQRWTLLLF